MFVKGKNVIILNMLSIFSYKQQEGIQMYDIIIIGAGPAGISAAIYGKSRGKRILMLEKRSGRRLDWNCLNRYTLYGNHERRIWKDIC